VAISKLYKKVYAYHCRCPEPGGRRGGRAARAVPAGDSWRGAVGTRAHEANIDLDRAWRGSSRGSALFNRAMHRLSLRL
jgi:hypothetical protein